MIDVSTFMWVVGGLIGAMLTLIGFTLRYILATQKTALLSLENSQKDFKMDVFVFKADQEKKILELVKNQNEIKYNYLKRFEEVNKNISEVKEEIVEKIHSLHDVIINIKIK